MQVVGRALELLRLLKHFRSMTLKEISSSLGVRGNSAWNLLSYLCEKGYAERKARGVYAPGPAFKELAGPRGEEASDGLGTALRKLSSTVKESSIAAALDGDRLELMAHYNYERELMVSDSIYDRRDALYCWAAGHVALSLQSETLVDAITRRNGMPKASQWAGVQSRGGLKAELKRIREEGYAERFAADCQIRSLAVPAVSPSGTRIVLGVAYPESRNTRMHRQAILANLKLLAEGISGTGGSRRRPPEGGVLKP